MQIRNWSLSILAVGILVQGCAHSQTEKDLNTQVSQEKSVSTYSDLRTESGELIAAAPGLTDAQRAKLQALREAVRAKVDAQWTSTLKLRSVLIKDMLAPKYNENEVEAIKGRMRDLEDDRLATIYDAVTQANTILGRQAVQNQRVLRDFMDEEPRGMRH